MLLAWRRVRDSPHPCAILRTAGVYRVSFTIRFSQHETRNQSHNLLASQLQPISGR